MSNALSDEQKALVSGWIAEGLSAGQIQSRIKDEFSLSLTYLDLRLLLDDLKVVPKEKETGEDADSASQEPVGEEELLPTDEDLGGGVSVSLDQITRPNSLVSGKVRFSDGEKAEWAVDSMGRLTLNPDTPGYRPSQEDVMAFQIELQKAARSAGL